MSNYRFGSFVSGDQVVSASKISNTCFEFRGDFLKEWEHCWMLNSRSMLNKIERCCLFSTDSSMGMWTATVLAMAAHQIQ